MCASSCVLFSRLSSSLLSRLYALLHPHAPGLPYVYDSLAWPHCDGVAALGAPVGSDSAATAADGGAAMLWAAVADDDVAGETPRGGGGAQLAARWRRAWRQ